VKICGGRSSLDKTANLYSFVSFIYSPKQNGANAMSNNRCQTCLYFTFLTLYCNTKSRFQCFNSKLHVTDKRGRWRRWWLTLSAAET